MQNFTAYYNTSIQIAQLFLVALVPLAYGQNDPNAAIITSPHPSEYILGDYAWSFAYLNAKSRRYANPKPSIKIEAGDQVLIYNNPHQHRPYLISQPVQLASDIDSIRLTLRHVVSSAHRTKAAYWISVKLLHDQQLVQLRHEPSPMLDTLNLTLSIPVKGFTGRLKIAIDFDKDIASGVIEGLSLKYLDHRSERFSQFPSEYLTVSTQTFQANEEVTLVLRHHPSVGLPEGLAWKITDHLGRQVVAGTWRSEHGAELPIGTLPLGWYRLTSTGVGSGTQNYSACTTFLVIPETTRQQDGFASPFGIHVEMNAAGLRTMELLGAGWARLNGANVLKWNTVEPVRGQWVWPDSVVAMFLDSGKALLGNLRLTPAWASSQPDITPHPSYPRSYFSPGAHLPKDMAAWENYVRRVVSRYRGRITHWEIWNEPDIHFLVADDRGKVDNYLRLLSSADSVIRDIDPSLRVLAPGVAYLITDDPVRNRGPMPDEQFSRYRDPRFFQDFKATDAGKYFDVFSFHHYSHQDRRLKRPTLVENNRLKNLVSEVVPKHFGVVDDVWVTEYNVVVPVEDFSHDLACAIARQVCLEHFELFARGVSKVFTYNANYNEFWFNPYDNFFDPPDPTPVFAAYAVMTWKLDGYSFYDYIDDAEGRLRHYRFVDGRTDTIHIFASISDAIKLSVPAEGILTDYLGKVSRVQKNDTWPLAKNEFIYFNETPKITK